MIDEEATFKRCGYYARDLKPKSNKKIVAVCDNCGKIREIRNFAYSALCRSCSQKGDRNQHWNGGKVKRKCEICGISFEVKRGRANINQGIYCSQKCLGIAYRGKKSPHWKGGEKIGEYRYKWNEKFREYIRNKFDRKCFLCGKTEKENKGRKLSVHHVNYDKNCGCANTEEDKKVDDATCQFIPLCMSCHSKAHHDREKYEKFFKSKLKNKLNGWYI